MRCTNFLVQIAFFIGCFLIITAQDASIKENIPVAITEKDISSTTVKSLASNNNLTGSEIDKHKKTTTTKKPTTSSTTEKSTTSSTTEKPTTSSTTEKPTTSSTTAKPTTSSTTAKPTTSSTTAKPTTTSTEMPTSTVKPVPPKPKPSPEVGTWNSSCVLLQFATQLNITYHTKDNKTAVATINLPVNASVDQSSCIENLEQVTLSWGPVHAINFLTVQFNKHESNYLLYMLTSKVEAIGDDFPNAKENQNIELHTIINKFETPINMSFHCTPLQTFNLTNVVTKTASPAGTVQFSHIQFEAFRTKTSTSFSSAQDCEGKDTPDIVPIAVGVALCTLILIVLIGYLVGRRRSTARGYMSF